MIRNCPTTSQETFNDGYNLEYSCHLEPKPCCVPIESALFACSITAYGDQHSTGSLCCRLTCHKCPVFEIHSAMIVDLVKLITLSLITFSFGIFTCIKVYENISASYHKALDHTLFFLFPGCKRVVEGEGMPMFRHPFEKGNLIIKFNIEFPENNFASEDKLKVQYLICLGIVISHCSVS